MTLTRPMKYAIEQRLRLIDFLLGTYGYINRSAICDYFGISMGQAAKDMDAYRQLAPWNMRYDTSARMHMKTDNFVRLYA